MGGLTAVLAGGGGWIGDSVWMNIFAQNEWLIREGDVTVRFSDVKQDNLLYQYISDLCHI